MPKTNGFTTLYPSLFCVAFIGASMYLLSLSARTIPLGTAYAVWVGLRAVGTAIYAITVFGEDKSALRVFCLFLIVAAIAGLEALTPSRA